MHLDVGKLYKNMELRQRERERERGLLPHEIHGYLEHRQVKKSQHVDTIIAGRETAESRKRANYCRMIKELKTRNESCGTVFNVLRSRDEINR